MKINVRKTPAEYPRLHHLVGTADYTKEGYAYHKTRLPISPNIKKKLKPIQKFRKDVNKGDLVRIVFEKSGEKVGYLNRTEGAPPGFVACQLTSSSWTNPKSLSRGSTSMRIHETNLWDSDRTFVYTRGGHVVGEMIDLGYFKLGEKILGYHVLKRRKE